MQEVLLKPCTVLQGLSKPCTVFHVLSKPCTVLQVLLKPCTVLHVLSKPCTVLQVLLRPCIQGESEVNLILNFTSTNFVNHKISEPPRSQTQQNFSKKQGKLIFVMQKFVKKLLITAFFLFPRGAWL